MDKLIEMLNENELTYAYMANRNFRWCVRTRPGLTRFTSRVCL